MLLYKAKSPQTDVFFSGSKLCSYNRLRGYHTRVRGQKVPHTRIA
jgi:hypothetical protein